MDLYVIRCIFYIFLFYILENKASMENLDGKVKSSLFGNKTGSKVKVPNSGSKGKGVKSSAKTSKKKPIIKPSTSKEVNDQTNPPNNPTSKVDQNQRRRAISPQFSQSSKQSNPKKINNNDEMDEEDENMSTGNNSADLFSSEQEENTGKSIKLYFYYILFNTIYFNNAIINI